MVNDTGNVAHTPRTSAPLPVKAIALGLMFISAWLLIAKVVPVWTTDLKGLSALLGAVYPLGLAIGLLRVERWAWGQLALASFACWLGAVCIFAGWERWDLGTRLVDPAGDARRFAALGVVALAVFVVLVHSTTRRAFAVQSSHARPVIWAGAKFLRRQRTRRPRHSHGLLPTFVGHAR